ncbi:phosphoglycerate mutase [Herbaspirillum rubrisubalbicans]|uniref:Phosphoglycerate mutase n=2 Tax=Herbaspirillum rubrisubalbicans TaxID=80842 RepID=A0ABX9C6R1_9BURK|nr:histidine phosphatase family protein [Herbaspirillum rubrisubalbicans]MCP1571996.1 alpha-ribazole phosphatase [Herbaspirillum rubrisubalbicans]QJQ00653.1 phosphoglycerate mutase [Herbaspirillum rubrisubalbicans Os34]RAM66110.1 phosphoglycerate mutase [Herbaspirillum rubrisubalbicans]RAN50438.1 phosphoglycerate mutase [Herbaspirillum rubrisubalbicans]
MQLYLIRHPQPLLDKHTCYGRSDIAVAPAMLAQCVTQLLPALQALPPGLTMVSSPLRRCADLAQALAEQLSWPAPALEPRLQEMDFGNWELRPWDDIPWAEVEAWNADLLHHAPGGGETLLAVAQRMWQAFASLLAQPAPGAIVICHAGSIRMLQACAAWRAEQGSMADNIAASTPQIFDDIALRAVAQRQEIPYAQVLPLDLSMAQQR